MPSSATPTADAPATIPIPIGTSRERLGLPLAFVENMLKPLRVDGTRAAETSAGADAGPAETSGAPGDVAPGTAGVTGDGASGPPDAVAGPRNASGSVETGAFTLSGAGGCVPAGVSVLDGAGGTERLDGANMGAVVRLGVEAAGVAGFRGDAGDGRSCPLGDPASGPTETSGPAGRGVDGDGAKATGPYSETGKDGPDPPEDSGSDATRPRPW